MKMLLNIRFSKYSSMGIGIYGGAALGMALFTIFKFTHLSLVASQHPNSSGIPSPVLPVLASLDSPSSSNTSSSSNLNNHRNYTQSAIRSDDVVREEGSVSRLKNISSPVSASQSVKLSKLKAEKLVRKWQVNIKCKQVTKVRIRLIYPVCKICCPWS